MTTEERFKRLESDLREHLKLISGLMALQMSLARTVEMLVDVPASDRIDNVDEGFLAVLNKAFKDRDKVG